MDVLSRDPGNTDILAAMSTVQSAQDRFVAALEWADRALAIDADHVAARAARINSLIWCGRYEEAEDAQRQAVAAHPANPDILIAAARLASHLDHDDEAIEWIERALTVDAHHVEALAARISYLHWARRDEEAEEAAQTALQRCPMEPVLATLLAAYFVHRKHYAEADELLDGLLRLDPGNAVALSSRLDSLRLAGRHGDAAEAAKAAVERRPESAPLLIAAARVALTEDRYDDSLALLEQALALEPDSAKALDVRIRVLRDAGRPTDAAVAAAEAVRLRPDAPDVLVTAAWEAMHGDRNDESIALIELALKHDQLHTPAHMARINFLRWYHRDAEADLAVRAALAARPRRSSVLVAAARQHHWMDRQDEAVACLDEALLIKPHDSELSTFRIALLRAAGRYQQAEEDLDELLQRSPQDPDVLVAAAALNSEKDHDVEALEWVDRALTADPQHLEALSQRIELLRWVGRYSEADQAVRTLIDHNPDDPYVFAHVSGYYSDLHRFAESLKWIERAISLAPEDNEIRRQYLDQLRRAHQHEAAGQQAAELLTSDAAADPAALVSVAWWASAQGRFEDMLDLTARALSAAPSNPGVLIARMRALQLLRRDQDVDEAAREAYRCRPRNPSVLLEIAGALSRRDNEAEAVRWADRALAVDPLSAEALSARIDFLVWARRFDEAKQAVEEALKVRPRSTEVMLAAAWLSIGMDDPNEALAWVDRSLSIDAYDSEALTLQVDFLQRLRRYDEAHQKAARAVELLPDDPDMHRSLGLVLDAQLNFAEALDSFATGQAIAPYDTDLIVARSATLRSMRRYGDAEREVTMSRSLQPYDRDLQTELGWIHHDQRRLAEAKRCFEMLYSSARNSTERGDAAIGLGWTAFAGGRYPQAEAFFRQAVELDPYDDDYQLALAWALTRQNNPSRWDEARRIAHAASVRVANPPAHICLGVLAFRTGEFPSAEFHLQRALDLDQYRGSLTDLGALYAQMSRRRDAEEVLQKAIKRDRYDAAAHIELGAVLLAAGGDRLPESELLFRQALAIDPTEGTAAVGLAQVLERVGDDTEAETCLRQCLQAGDVHQRWRVELALARVLIGRGDKQQNVDIFTDAYKHAQRAIDRAPGSEADPHYVAGVAYHRMGSLAVSGLGSHDFRRRASQHLKQCLERDSAHIEAQRSLLLLEREKKASGPLVHGGYALAVMSCALLVLLWLTFFFSSKISGVVVGSVTPVLVGLFAVSLLLPSLIKLKMPGFEADLQAGTGSLTPGPTGEITFGPNRFTVSTGPAGKLGRRQ
ncbi:tetratricopeptide repeat protein [Kribbella sp. NPDC051770]|uniref:tetratricopeptide repeat protein n=1 Tax=Kribbella sp. NPDC051770 TaxID=3155413 RepID=UPI00342F3638